MPHYPEHLRNFAYLGLHRYFLTFCTHNRRRHFEHADVVRLVSEQILRASACEHFAVPAYCYMPDHTHLLAEGTRDDADLKRFVKVAKQYSAFYFTQRTGQRLWQRYGFERVLRSDEVTVTVVRYIITNPIRAGLVARVDDYPFWGSLTHSREELIEYIQRAT